MIDEKATTETPATEKPTAAQKPNGRWKSKIAACRAKRDELNKTWQENVAFRKNKVYPAVSATSTNDDDAAQDRIAVPVDWTRTKNKIAQLFFQVPKIQLKARRPEFEVAAPIAASALNFELEHEMRVFNLMDECLGDAINATGFMAALVGFEAQTEKIQVPAIDESAYSPEQIEQLKAQNGGSLPTQESERTVYQRIYGKRISGAQLVWPADFTGSDFQTCEYLGYDDRCTYAEALRLGWIDETYECEDSKLDTTNQDVDDDPLSKSIGKYVRFTRLWYRKSSIDPTVKDPRALGHIVLVEGQEKPAIDEDFTWQVFDPESRTWGGMTTFPIKVGTLVYISDEANPPSDSEIGRAQVMELNKSRSQMITQRERSHPMRWYDVNMVDEVIAEKLTQGTLQGMIPMNGPGDRAVGEIARANYPRETFQFQQIIERDLDEAWSSGPNQQGFSTPGDTSAAEVNAMASAANVRLEYERARVLRFFLEIAEGTLALMQMFQDDEKWVELEGPGGLKKLEAWDKSRVRGDFAFVCKPDAAARIDAGQKRVESLNVYKLLRRDPLANGAAILKEVLIWHGFDLADSMVPPAKPEPKPAALRFTFKGEDLTNPIAVALAQKNSTSPLTPEDISAAQAMMAAAKVPNMTPEVMPVPQPNQHGQLPTIAQIENGTAKHPGPPAQVDPLGQRYSQGNPSEGGE